MKTDYGNLVMHGRYHIGKELTHYLVTGANAVYHSPSRYYEAHMGVQFLYTTRAYEKLPKDDQNVMDALVTDRVALIRADCVYRNATGKVLANKVLIYNIDGNEVFTVAGFQAYKQTDAYKEKLASVQSAPSTANLSPMAKEPGIPPWQERLTNKAQQTPPHR